MFLVIVMSNITIKKEVSSLIKSNSLKYESTSNNENLYSSYMNALDKIKK